jgi:hypothetical protein
LVWMEVLLKYDFVVAGNVFLVQAHYSGLRVYVIIKIFFYNRAYQ